MHQTSTKIYAYKISLAHVFTSFTSVRLPNWSRSRSVQKWNPMKRCHDRTLHTALHKKPLEMRATCCWWWCGGGLGFGWGVKERGNVEGIQKYSFIVSRPQDEALCWAGQRGCGPGVCTLLQPEPHQSSGACVIWSGPLGREEASLVDPPEPPLKLATGMGGQWCKAAPGNKQLWLWQANGKRLVGPSSRTPPGWQQRVIARLWFSALVCVLSAEVRWRWCNGF